MGKASSGTKQQVTQYNASIHFGICSGPVDYISQIIVNEKEAWAGEQSVQGTITISDKMELFGGDKKEGGVQGVVEYLPGDSDQTISELLAGKVGLTTATMPAYRGITSAWFHGRNLVEPEDEGLGFYWTANSPYLPGVWIKVARASIELNEEHARIWRGGERSTRLLEDFNDSSTIAWLLWDISGSLIAHTANGDVSTIIIEDLRTGEVQSEIDIDYVPLWIFISPSLGHILVAGNDNQLHSYGPSGEEVASVHPVGVDLTAGVDTEGELNGSPCEIVVDGVTYLFFMAWTTLVCCSRSSGSDWTTNWGDADWGVFNLRGITAASPDYVVVRMSSGNVYRVAWSPDAMGSAVSPDFLGLLGWNINSTEPIGSVSYIPASDTWFFTTNTGPIATLNSDLTSVVASGDIGADIGVALQQPVKSRHILQGDGTAVFIQVDNVYLYTIATCTLVEAIPVSEWDISLSAVQDSGYSDEENAIVISGSTDVVLFFPHGEFDSNPAHIIYDCLTNTDWGMGAAASAIDFASFTSAAATLYAEAFGLSMIWTKQSTIEAFVSEVLDHIEATIFVSPFTGLLTLKLIRNDYSITGLDEFTPDNSVVTNWQRKLWGETVNEIVVSWTNPENEETETVVAQDNANIEAQGGIVSDGRNYYGVRVKDLAMRLAQRDLRAASTPLASCDIEVNREAWALLPGDVVILNSPEDDIVSIVMRVGPVDYGKPGDPTVKASLVEDVWALPLADYTVPPDTLAEDTSEAPTPADDTLIFTLPYFVTVNKIDASTLSGVGYPEVFAGVLASEDGQDTFEFELYGQGTDNLGNPTVVNLGTKTIASHATLPEAFVAEVSTEFVFFTDRTKGNGPSVGGFMLIQGNDETEHELCIFTAIETSSPQLYTVNRGVLDTIPRTWPAGTSVWFIDAGSIFHDPTIRSEAEVVAYRILPRTSLGLLAYVNAPVTTETLTARPHLPSRPAAVTIDLDDGFSGIVNLVGVDPIPVTFARRNRETEDTIILAWDDGDVTPETGQTTTVRLLDLADNVLHEYTGIAGTSQDVDPADFGSEGEGYIEVTAVRDGLESLQPYRVRVIVSGETFEFEDGTAYEFEDGEPKLFED